MVVQIVDGKHTIVPIEDGVLMTDRAAGMTVLHVSVKDTLVLVLIM